MRKLFGKLSRIGVLSAVALLAYSTYFFLNFNAPIIKQDILLGTTLTLNLVALVAGNFVKKEYKAGWLKILNLILVIGTVAFIVVSLLNSILVDYFQPLSLYDQIIYAVLAALLLLVVLLIVHATHSLVAGRVELRMLLTMGLTVVMILQIYALGALQKPFEYTNIDGEEYHVFEGGEAGYSIFRIPTLLVIPKGAELASGRILQDDRVIAMAEARRHGSLDDGEIDLVQKISEDGGLTWSELTVVRSFEDGVGKIGNSTPVFDMNSGEVILPHLAGAERKDYKTYCMISGDGGVSWSEPEYVFDGIVGPGHGIMIDDGDYAGRLVVPGYMDGGSLSIYSDDHGRTWHVSEKLSDGNEAEIVQTDEDGSLLMVVRTDIGVATPHEKLNKLYVTSDDGGASWSEFNTFEDIKEPICMSSIVNSKGDIYYSHPDDYYSRGQMTVAASYDKGMTFTERKIIYQGAAGYSELGVLENGDLLLLFESGAIEYDERITLVRVPRF